MKSLKKFLTEAVKENQKISFDELIKFIEDNWNEYAEELDMDKVSSSSKKKYTKILKDIIGEKEIICLNDGSGPCGIDDELEGWDVTGDETIFILNDDNEYEERLINYYPTKLTDLKNDIIGIWWGQQWTSAYFEIK